VSEKLFTVVQLQRIFYNCDSFAIASCPLVYIGLVPVFKFFLYIYTQTLSIKANNSGNMAARTPVKT